jgi:hypothetical protein
MRTTVAVVATGPKEVHPANIFDCSTVTILIELLSCRSLLS